MSQFAVNDVIYIQIYRRDNIYILVRLNINIQYNTAPE